MPAQAKPTINVGTDLIPNDLNDITEDVILTGTVADETRIRIPAGNTLNITFSNLSITDVGNFNAAFEIQSGATVHLTLEDNNTLISGEGRGGLEVLTGAFLFIEGEGELTATGGDYGSGIGGGNTGSGGTITIYGGTIWAAGSGGGSGIGGGINGSGGTTTIYGGEIIAKAGNNNAAAIGAGQDNSTHGSTTVHGTHWTWTHNTGNSTAGATTGNGEFTNIPASYRYIQLVDTREQITWTELTANGESKTTNTTELTLTFSAEPTGLTADNIKVMNATKGALTALTSTTYTLAISDIKVSNGKNVTVRITSPADINITPPSRKVQVWNTAPPRKVNINVSGGSLIIGKP